MNRIVEFKKGAVAAVPVSLGYIPVGIAYGLMAGDAGLNLGQILGFSLFVYTGAGQMAAARMIAMQISMPVIVLTVSIMNLRHIIMSTVIMEKLRSLPLLKRCLLSFFITDETFAVFTMEERKKPTGWFFLGLGLCSWLSWNIGSALGAISGSLLPETLSASLGISMSAMFIALVVPGMKRSIRICLLVALSAFLSWLFSLFVSSSLAIVGSILLSSFAGTFFVKDEDLS